MKYKNYVGWLVIVILAMILFAPQRKDWIDILGALGPVIVAGLVGYVAYRQYKIEEYKKRTMFYSEKMQALEDLYILVFEALSLTDEELQQSRENLKDSKRGQILQKFYILDIRFRTLFNNNRIRELRDLFENRNVDRFNSLENKKFEEYYKEMIQASKSACEKDRQMETLHDKIKEEILEEIKV